MTTLRRMLLTITLTMLLLGLVAHSLPVPLCECATLERSAASNPDFCMFCQLQSGVHLSEFAAYHTVDSVYLVGHQSPLHPLEYVFSVLRPPIS
jgi:hypothetical protein